MDPMTQVSGFELTSTRTVGVHTNRTNKSAMLKFVRKMFVEFRMSFVLRITIGTWEGKGKNLLLNNRLQNAFSFQFMLSPLSNYFELT